MDNTIDVLGLDDDRDKYYHNSRLLLPDHQQANCVYTVELETNWLEYQLPEKVAILKSLKIYKDEEETEIDKILGVIAL